MVLYSFQLLKRSNAPGFKLAREDSTVEKGMKETQAKSEGSFKHWEAKPLHGKILKKMKIILSGYKQPT